MKVRIINELAPTAAPATTMAAAAGTPPVAATPATSATNPQQGVAQTATHPLDPSVLPIIKKQIFDALNPLTNAYIKSAIDKTLNDVLSKVQVK